MPDEVAPLPVGTTQQIAAIDAGAAVHDAGKATALAHVDTQPTGCIDSQKRQLRIRQAGADRYIVPREVVNVVRSERKSQVTRQVDQTTGQQIGYSIVDVGDGSCLQALGFRNGDLVRSLNGRELTDWGVLMQSYASIMKDGSAVVRLDRGGRAMTLVFEIQN